MIIVKLYGGLGNQLFQYALGRLLAITYDSELKFDLSFYDEQTESQYELHHFCINIPRATPDECHALKSCKPSILTRIKWALLCRKQYSSVPAKSFYWEKKRNTFDPTVLNRGPDAYLDGLWQTEKYFISISEIIRTEVQLRHAGSTAFQEVALIIQDHPSVSIHVRRGDYLNHPVFASCTLDYYKRAISHISSATASPTFFVFSNDIAWCREHLPVPASTVFVGNKDPLPPHEDLMLMSMCDHNITANSTFSWWGAWLNRNPDKVVCTPSRWHCNGRQIHDTLPAQWIQFDL